MAGSAGAAGLAVAAVVSALVAAGVSTLVASSDAPPAPSEARGLEADVEALRLEVAAMRRDAARVRDAIRTPRVPEPDAAPSPDAAPADGGESAKVPVGAGSAAPADGSFPVTRAELDALIDARVDERLAAAGGAAAALAPKQVTLEEAGEEIGLSPSEVETTRRIYRDAEEEVLRCLFGTHDLREIRREVEQMKDDPDRKAAFIQRAIGNAIPNLGRLMTLESKRDGEVRRLLGEERAKRLKGMHLKPVSADEDLGRVLEDVFGN